MIHPALYNEVSALLAEWGPATTLDHIAERLKNMAKEEAAGDNDPDAMAAYKEAYRKTHEASRCRFP